MRLAPLILLVLPAFATTLAAPASNTLAGRHALVVIVNPAAHVRKLDRNQVVDIFMGRFRQLPTGATALPIDLANNAVRAQFYQRLVHWSLAQVGSYWARLVFSGQASPPFRASNARAAVQLVATNPNAIAYVPRSAVNSHVRIVLDLGSH